MLKNLPIEMLRSFVAIAENGSMSRAAKDVYLTQSALSLQMKRLSELAETPLFDRHFRGVLLTPGGNILLNYARAILDLNDRAISSLKGEAQTEPVRIGIIQDFADGILPNVLIRFSQANPNTQLQIRVGNSTELRALQAEGLLDVAICLADLDDPAILVKSPLLWLGLPTPFSGPIPLVLMEKPCRFRDAALAALEEAGVAYRIVMETPNLNVLCSAVNAAIGVTCRSPVFLSERLPVLHSLNLPLPDIAVAAYSAPSRSGQMRQLLQLARSAVISLDARSAVKS